MAAWFDGLPDAVVLSIMRASDFSLAFSCVDRRVYGLSIGAEFARHWVRALLRAGPESDARKASERRVAATEFYLQHLPLHMRRLNVHRVVEIAARGAREGASARLAGLADAVWRACDDSDAMLVLAGCLMDVAYVRVLNFQGALLHQQGNLPRHSTGPGALANVRCFTRDRAAPCKPPYRCAASRGHMRDAGLNWELVRETARRMLARLEPSIVRTIREERIGGASVYTDEALVEAARCNVGMCAGAHAMGAHTLHLLVLAYMDPELRPEVVRRWGPLSFFATSSVQSLGHLFTPSVREQAVRAHESGLFARATRDDLAAASARLPLFRGALMWDTGKVRCMTRAFASAELAERVVRHWNVARVTTRRERWTDAA